MFEDDDSVFSAMRAGARGYVLKGAPPNEILKVLRAVADGEAHFGPEIARRLMSFFSEPKPAAGGDLPRSQRPRGGDPRPYCPGPPQRQDRRLDSSSAPRQWPTTSPTSSPSCRSPTAPTPSSGPAKRDGAGGYVGEHFSILPYVIPVKAGIHEEAGSPCLLPVANYRIACLEAVSTRFPDQIGGWPS